MNPIDGFRSTHDLCDVLPRAGILIVQLTDGDTFEVSECWPIDYSIYQLRGGWCGTVEQYLGTSDKKKRLFRPRSGIDLYESDIVSVADKSDGKVLYQRTVA